MASYPVNRHFDLQLNVYNLFDKDYVAAINKSGYRYTPVDPALGHADRELPLLTLRGGPPLRGPPWTPVMLLHIPEVLSTEQASRIRAALQGADWTDGRETVGAQGARVKHNQQLPDASPLRRQLGQLVLAALARHPLVPRRRPAPAHPAAALQPLHGGGHYGFHVDGAVMALADGVPAAQRHLLHAVPQRTGDYDGGELIVSDTYGEHEVKLPAGDLIIYPSSSLHRVQPVTRGARLAAFFWVQSLVRDDAQRRLLFELDTLDPDA